MMWFCCYHWYERTQWGVLLASPLCCSINISPGCLLRLKPMMPWVLLDFVKVGPSTLCQCLLWPLLSFSRVEPPTDFIMLVSVMVFAVYVQVLMWPPFSPRGLSLQGLHHHNCLECTHGRHVHGPHQRWAQ